MSFQGIHRSSHRIVNLLLPIMAATTLIACSTATKPIVETRGEFATRDADGVTEYAYSYFWYKSLEKSAERQLRSSKRQSIGMLDKDTRMQLYLSGQSVPLSNEEKIRLEDEAAANLERELANRSLCSKGHQINQVIWRDRSLSLIGRCT